MMNWNGVRRVELVELLTRHLPQGTEANHEGHRQR